MSRPSVKTKRIIIENKGYHKARTKGNTNQTHIVVASVAVSKTENRLNTITRVCNEGYLKRNETAEK